MQENNINQNINTIKEEMAKHQIKCSKMLMYMSPILKKCRRKTIHNRYLSKKKSMNLNNYKEVADLLIGRYEEKIESIVRARQKFLIDDKWKDELIKNIQN